MKSILSAALAATVMLYSSPNLANAETGVNDTRILFGQTAAIEGPASALGTGMRDGILAAFKKYNDNGGVKGVRLDVNILNDGYEPEKAIENTNQLINDDKVFALIGAVGTPTSKVIQPLSSDAQVPLIGPFTGAGFLRAPHKPYVINVRGTYDSEAETWIKHLTEDLGAKNIGILYQDDSFGRAGLSGVNKALEKRGMSLAAEATYTRNTTVVKGAVLSMKKANPDAIVTVGAYKPIAEFIKVSRKVGIDVPILNISFTGSKALAKELEGIDVGDVIVTQVVPFPFDVSKALVAEYQEALKTYDSSLEPGFVSLEGYMVGKVTAMALESIEGEITRQKFIDSFAKVGDFDLGGVTLSYGETDNQGMDDIFLTRLDGSGGFKNIDSLK